MSSRGVFHVEREINKFEKYFEGSTQPIDLESILLASEANTFLVNKFEVSIDAYSADLRSQITSNLVQGLALRDTNQRTVSQINQDVGRFFLGEEWKINRIVRTEMHNIYNFSKLNALDAATETLPDLKKSLMHPMDARTGDDSKKLARENPVVDIDEPFRFTFKGKVRIFMFPPDRPNDRSILVPFRESWDRRAAEFENKAS
jgi:hypothetical protein